MHTHKVSVAFTNMHAHKVRHLDNAVNIDRHTGRSDSVVSTDMHTHKVNIMVALGHTGINTWGV